MLARQSSFLSDGDVGAVSASMPPMTDERLIVTFFPPSLFLASLAAAVLSEGEVGLIGSVWFVGVRLDVGGGIGLGGRRGCVGEGGGGSAIGLCFCYGGVGVSDAWVGVL